MIILQVFVFDKTSPGSKDSSLVQPERAPSGHPKVHFFKAYFFVSCFPTMPLNRTKLKYGTMKLKAFEKIHGWLSLVQYIFSDQRVLFQCNQRVHSECNLGCTSCGAINEELSSKPFTRNQIKICGHVAKYLSTFYSKVWIWCDMAKGLVLFIH